MYFHLSEYSLKDCPLGSSALRNIEEVCIKRFLLVRLFLNQLFFRIPIIFIIFFIIRMNISLWYFLIYYYHYRKNSLKVVIYTFACGVSLFWRYFIHSKVTTFIRTKKNTLFSTNSGCAGNTYCNCSKICKMTWFKIY